MGYYTRYSLSWKVSDAFKVPPPCEHADANPSTAKFCQECGASLSRVLPDRLIGDAVVKMTEGALGRDGKSLEPVKWYEHETDMAALSSRFPGVVFHLAGEGENNDDIWDLFALDGRVQTHKAKIFRQAEPEPREWTAGKARLRG